MKPFYNTQLQLAYDFVQYTDQNIFLTGKAGTGKTTFLLNLKDKLNKRMVVVAPTGVAAINAGGVTIHSFFQLPFGPHIPADSNIRTSSETLKDAFNQVNANKFNRDKINIFRSLDLLIIDEISMVRADVLDAIDEVLRRYKDRYKPFGGVQLLMIGDLQQLPPVVKNEDWEFLRDYYTTMFFFGSKALQKTSYVPIELKHIYRQNDEAFIKLLNKVRDNHIDAETLNELNKRYIPDFATDSEEGYITLTSHVALAYRINESKLEKLPGKENRFDATVTGDFPEYSFPTENQLVLKKGAQVMFVKNDASFEKQFYNGKIGKIVKFENEKIIVQCPDDTFPITVEPMEWSNNKYSIDESTKEIKESVIGTFTQFPLKLAWAITIHKSQGLTFERAIIDANAAFAHGQVYVALSRCKTLEGIVLNSPISPNSVKTDSSITAFNIEAEQNQPDEQTLLTSKHAFQQKLLIELFDFIPIERRLNTLLKLLNENKASLLEAFREVYFKMDNRFKKEILSFTKTFANQINQLIAHHSDVEMNNELQDRVTKGSSYFLDKTNEIIYNILQNTPLETDNKEVRKTIYEAIEKLAQETNIKISCLRACQKGFSVMTYLNTRAKASIDKPDIRRIQRGAEEFSSAALPNPKLYSLLRKWRNNKAEENNTEMYMVLQQKSLVDLVTKLPTNKIELKKVNGFGKVKVNMFGDEILGIIKAYLADQDLKNIDIARESSVEYTKTSKKGKDKPIEEIPKPAFNAKIEKPNSKLLSLELFNIGHTIEDIAKERAMAVSTIESHLSHYVKIGKIEIQQIISPEKISLISEYCIDKQLSGIGQVKEGLGDKASYTEIKFVLSHLLYLKQMNSEPF